MSSFWIRIRIHVHGFNSSIYNIFCELLPLGPDKADAQDKGFPDLSMLCKNLDEIFGFRRLYPTTRFWDSLMMSIRRRTSSRRHTSLHVRVAVDHYHPRGPPPASRPHLGPPGSALVRSSFYRSTEATRWRRHIFTIHRKCTSERYPKFLQSWLAIILQLLSSAGSMSECASARELEGLIMSVAQRPLGPVYIATNQIMHLMHVNVLSIVTWLSQKQTNINIVKHYTLSGQAAETVKPHSRSWSALARRDWHRIARNTMTNRFSPAATTLEPAGHGGAAFWRLLAVDFISKHFLTITTCPTVAK